VCVCVCVCVCVSLCVHACVCVCVCICTLACLTGAVSGGYEVSERHKQATPGLILRRKNHGHILLNLTFPCPLSPSLPFPPPVPSLNQIRAQHLPFHWDLGFSIGRHHGHTHVVYLSLSVSLSLSRRAVGTETEGQRGAAVRCGRVRLDP